jgi:hypothetical protein
MQPRYSIEGCCEPDGPGTGYLLCEDAFATRWFVVDAVFNDSIVNFDNRQEAVDYVAQAESYRRRPSKFTWGPDDVEHH